MKPLHGLVAGVLLAAIAHATPPDDLMVGVGDGPHTEMLFKYEVTFMKFDVANVGAVVPAAVGMTLAPMVEGQTFSKDRANEMETILIDADPVLLSMAFLRDAGLNKFMNGHKKSTEAAQKTGHITEDERTAVLAGIEQDMASLQERGVKKNDVVYYRVEGDQVRTVYIGSEGEELLNLSRTDPAWARAFRAGWFCSESTFRDKLIKSLYKKQD